MPDRAPDSPSNPARPGSARPRPAVEPGLCGACRHARVIETPRAVYHFCKRSSTDATFRKYPALPVVHCRGFEPQAG